jgi:hypothetical protein
MYSVNVFPLGPGETALTASATNCSTAADLCGLVLISSGGTGAPDDDPNKVVVQYGDGGTDGAGTEDGPDNGFSVTAISG